MHLRFLGTSAGELYPGIWCRCANCQTARTSNDGNGRSGKNKRQSAALYVEPGLPHRQSEGKRADAPAAGILIDMPSEIVSQANRHNVDLPGLQYLLVTHSHGDHWFPYLLRWRSGPAQLCPAGENAPHEIGGARLTALPTLHIWGNTAVEAVLHRELGDSLEPFAVEFHLIQPGSQFMVGSLSVTALLAHHDRGRENCLHYVIRDSAETQNPKTLLYGLDGDTFLPETRDALRAFRFDMVVLEATFGFGQGSNHRNFGRLLEEADWFRDQNLLGDGGKILASHFSPHHCPTHQETEEFLQPRGVLTAWDGLEMEL